MIDRERLVARINHSDPWLRPYLLGWAGLGPPEPWGAAMSFALEIAKGYSLIRGESDATLTELGEEVVAMLNATGGDHELG